MMIAVDFDGTIADHRYPEIGEPVPGAFPYLKIFQSLGAELYLWTMRSDGQDGRGVLTEAVEFCRERGTEFHGINENLSAKSWTSSPKCYAHLYIDDVAFGCPLCENPECRPYVNWEIVGPKVMQMLLGDSV